MSDDMHKTLKGGPKLGTLAFALEEVGFLIEHELWDKATTRLAELEQQHPQNASLAQLKKRMIDAQAKAASRPKKGPRVVIKPKGRSGPQIVTSPKGGGGKTR